MDEFFEETTTLTRSQRKRQRRSKNSNMSSNHNQQSKNTSMEMINVVPKNKKQRLAFQAYEQGQHLMLSGVPGCGKTYLALYLALKSVLDLNQDFKKVIIIRSAQSSKSIGFLPGTAAAKMEAYEAPYISICKELFGRSDAYSILKQKKMIEFMSTSFLRGTTFNDAVVIVEEYQNLQGNELYLALSRIGQNTRVILSGDIRQTDLKFDDEKFGFTHFVKIISNMSYFSTVEFEVEDIVRSGFVKQFIVETLKYMDRENVKLL